MVRSKVFVALLCAGLAACGANPAADREPSTAAPVTSVLNDPGLSAAADAVVPELESRFRDTYSGVELLHRDHTMVIYRLSDPRLEEFVRARIPDARVVFRDGRFSLAHMRDVARQVMRDKDYWSGQGIVVNGAGPRPDGAAVEVLTATGSRNEERALNVRYGEGVVTVRQETPVPGSAVMPTGVPYTPPSGS